MMDAYSSLLEKLRSISILNSVAGVLSWDQELHMPPRGGDGRAAQMALLSSLVHERLTSDEMGALLDRLVAASGQEAQSPEAAANIRETRRVCERKRKLQGELVEQLARIRSQGTQAWRAARQASDFKILQPWLERHLELQKRAADVLGYCDEPYDALLDEYEPGMTASQLGAMFGQLGAAIVPMVRQRIGTSSPPDRSIFERFYPAGKQNEWARMLAQTLGFDFEAGRLDICTHAFSETAGRGDVRLVVRCNENNPLALTYSLLHEVGHGLYEQGLSEEHQGTPMGQAASLGVHESQSRLWENTIGRSRAFWEFALPRFKTFFAGTADDLDVETAFACVTEIMPSLRRVGSDELTYNLHILLRFELERNMINGRLRVAELPDAWNAAMQKYLGLFPPNDAQGVLQDVHWSMYYVGYFPTYLLGNVYAAQIYAAAERDLPDIETQVSLGVFKPLREWLRERIHCLGMRYQAAELIESVTGEPPSGDAYLAYLQRKFPVPPPPAAPKLQGR